MTLYANDHGSDRANDQGYTPGIDQVHDRADVDLQDIQYADQYGSDPQLTLGTASLLGIFFGLVLICGIFFGFGYSLGRRSAVQVAAAANPRPQVDSGPVKPGHAGPASPSQSSAPVTTPALTTPAPDPIPSPMNDADLRTAPAAVSSPAPRSSTTSMPSQNAKTGKTPGATGLSTASELAALQQPVLPKPSAIHPINPQPGPSANIPYVHRVPITPGGMTNPSTYTPPFNVNAGYSHLSGRQALVVQIAALSREDDAEVLASALRKRGYIAAVRTDEDDSLFHVQVGPYQRSVAMATRQRLIANGYNAIVK